MIQGKRQTQAGQLDWMATKTDQTDRRRQRNIEREKERQTEREREREREINWKRNYSGNDGLREIIKKKNKDNARVCALR